MEIFKAGVQYNDYKGTVAADRSDTKSLSDHLVKMGLCSQDERVVAIRTGFGGNDGHEISPSFVFYLQEGSHDDPANVIRAIDVKMPFATFFSFFKRFDMVMTIDGDTFDGIDVDGPHYGE